MTIYSLVQLNYVLSAKVDNRGKTPPLSDFGFPMVEVKHIRENQLYPVLDDTKFVSPETWETWFRAHLEPEDILFSTVGSIARTCLVPKNSKICIAQNIVGLRINRNQAIPRYIFYALKSTLFLGNVDGYTISTVQNSIKVNDLIKCYLPLPPLPIQRRIAEILSRLDDKIEVNRRINRTLEAMAQALYQHWFVDFGPFQAGEFVESELGLIPQGWQVGEMQDLFLLQRGFDLPAKTRTIGNYPVIAASGLNGMHSEYKAEGPGVVTGRSGVIGQVFYVQNKFWPLNTTLWIREFRRSSPLHAYHFLRNFDLSSFNSGSAVPTLNRNDIHHIPTIVPASEFVALFEKKVGNWFTLVHESEKEIEKLIEIRDYLLPKLLSGEIPVEAATEQVDDIIDTQSLQLTLPNF